MESTQELSSDQRALFILYGSFNQPSDLNVHQKIDDSDEKLDLSLSLSCYGSSSSSSSTSSNKKRKATHNPEYGSSLSRHGSSSSLSSYNSEIVSPHHHIPEKPLKIRNTVLLDSQESMTQLRVAPPDPFTIKKTLEESDVNDLARLMLAKRGVEAHVLAYWDNDMKERLNIDNEGVAVKVWDLDCDIEHDMKMKIWGCNRSVVINDRWISKFVRRRGLKKGDRIGLCWDQSDRRLVFSVLQQVPIDATPISFRRPNHQ